MKTGRAVVIYYYGWTGYFFRIPRGNADRARRRTAGKNPKCRLHVVLYVLNPIPRNVFRASASVGNDFF